jgi:glucose/arabinose dehydrogenase
VQVDPDLAQPHGLAFSGSKPFVAESDQIDTFEYADGAVSNRRTVAAGLPDARIRDLGGAYAHAHALKSVAAVTGPDGAIYITDDYADAVYRLAPR